MRSDENVKQLNSDTDSLGSFGETTPRNSFSGGERDNLFVNHNGEQYYDVAGVAGLDDPGDGRTSALFDFDRDGWQDFVVASSTVPTIQLYRNRIGDVESNRGAGGNYLAFRFVGGNGSAAGSKEWSNRDGVGAQLHVTIGSRKLLREVRRGDGRAATNSATMLVGLGEATAADRVELVWPSGRRQELLELKAGTLVTFHENQDEIGGEPARFEPYAKNVTLGESYSQATNSVVELDQTLSVTIPVDADTRPKLNLFVAMFTTCASCKKQMPNVQHLRDELADEDIAIWGVPVKLEETPEELQAYVDKYSPAYEVLCDLPMAERESVKEFIEATWSDLVTPATIVTDGGGRVLGMMQGVPTLSEVRKLLTH